MSRAVDQIGSWMPDTLPSAQAEIVRLRKLARDWLAFGGEFQNASDLSAVTKLAQQLRRVCRTERERCRARPAARLLLAISQKPDWEWPKELLLQQALALRAGNYDACDDERTLIMTNVLVSYARGFLRKMGHPDGIETIWAQGYLIKADAAEAVFELAGIANGGRA